VTTLLFSVGIAVFFLTIWGVVMVGAHMLGKPVKAILTPNLAANRMTPTASSGGTQGVDLETRSPEART